jgi:methionine-rich copper-binding protein CopC
MAVKSDIPVELEFIFNENVKSVFKPAALTATNKHTHTNSHTEANIQAANLQRYGYPTMLYITI